MNALGISVKRNREIACKYGAEANAERSSRKKDKCVIRELYSARIE